MKKKILFLLLICILLGATGCEEKNSKESNTSNESNKKENIKKMYNVIEGEGTNIGDEVAIGDEHFYIMKITKDDVYLLAKYNLLVGKNCVMEGDDYTCKDIAETNLQDETAKGHGKYIYNTTGNNGVLAFSDKAYWGSYPTEYGYEYNKDLQIYYVYGEKSNLYPYINKYKETLEKNIKVKEARLIKLEETMELGCKSNGNLRQEITCDDAPTWLTDTTYWTGTIQPDGTVYDVNNNYRYIARVAYDIGKYNGIRPVIIISNEANLDPTETKEETPKEEKSEDGKELSNGLIIGNYEGSDEILTIKDEKTCSYKQANGKTNSCTYEVDKYDFGTFESDYRKGIKLKLDNNQEAYFIIDSNTTLSDQWHVLEYKK